MGQLLNPPTPLSPFVTQPNPLPPKWWHNTVYGWGLILGAVKITPIAAVYIATYILPLTSKIQICRNSAYEKLVRIQSDSFWWHYDNHEAQGLKAHKVFIQFIDEIRAEYVPHCLWRPRESVATLTCKPTTTELDLLEDIKKTDFDEQIIKSVAFQTLSI